MEFPLLEVRDLTVRLRDQPADQRPLVDRVQLTVAPGEVVALLGESGAGKSLTARALLDLLPPGLEFDGEILWRGQVWTRDDQRRARGRQIGLVFQETLTTLDPLFTARRQLCQVLQACLGLATSEAEGRVDDLLDSVGLDPKLGARFPHQLSGGQRQRLGIALALAGAPSLLIADEPTSALDPPRRWELIQCWRQLVSESDRALLLLTHDFELVESLCDRIVALDRGRVVEVGATADLLGTPRDPSVRRLVDSYRAARERRGWDLS